MTQFRVRPQEGEEPGATPMSANYADTINQMMEQLSNRTGKFATGGGEPKLAGSVMGEPQDRIANVIAGYLKMLSPDPNDPASMLPMGATVRNPLDKVSILGKKIWPKGYKYLDDRKDVDYWFRENKHMPEGAGGYTRINPSGDKAVIGISPQSREMLERALLKKQPPVGSSVAERYFGKTALPHEMVHGVNVHPTDTPRMVQRDIKKGADKKRRKNQVQGMPLSKQFRVQDDAISKSQGRVGKRIEAQMDNPSRPGHKSRIDENVLEWSQGYSPSIQADEALVQQSGASIFRRSPAIDEAEKAAFKDLEALLNAGARKRERNMVSIRDLLRDMGELD